MAHQNKAPIGNRLNAISRSRGHPAALIPAAPHSQVPDSRESRIACAHALLADHGYGYGYGYGKTIQKYSPRDCHDCPNQNTTHA